MIGRGCGVRARHSTLEASPIRPAMQLAIVTGGGSGIGAALVKRLATAEPKLIVVAIGRRKSKLDAMKLSMTEEEQGRILTVQADISTADGIASIVSSIPASPIKYLVHNAGLLGPISPLTDIDRSTWDKVIATNLSGPLFLTQALLPQLKRCVDLEDKKARVLHISSGAAKSAYCGWGPYCISKVRHLRSTKLRSNVLNINSPFRRVD